MDNIKLLKLSIFLTDVFFIILLCFTIGLPWMVAWYVETMGRSQSLATTILVTCYPCAPFCAFILLSIRRFLKLVIKDELFTYHSARFMRNISICSIAIAVITLIAGKFYMPFFIVGATFLFLSLLAFAMRAAILSQTEEKNDIKNEKNSDC